MSDDDFRTESLKLRSKKQFSTKSSKDDAELTTLVVESKWKGSNFIDKIQELFEKFVKLELKFVTSKPTSYFCDLEFPGLGPLNGLALLILTEADYLAGSKTYKQKVAKFFGSKKSVRSIVVCLRSEISVENFVDVQTFVAIEVGLVLIPLADLDKLPQLLVQLYLVEKGGKNRSNPFKFGAEKRTASIDKQLVQALQTIPGLGEKKARKLMENPNLTTLADIAKASVEELTKAVDGSTARAVYGFFNMDLD